VHLQRKVRDLEEQLASLEKEDQEPDPEEVVSAAAAVRLQESPESKFLGPASGIAITRLVMRLVMRFTESKSISDIVPFATAQHAKERYAAEASKPDSKVYPLVSNVAADGLPRRDVTNPLVELFNLKGVDRSFTSLFCVIAHILSLVQHMYPLFHEPTLLKDVEAVYNGSRDPYQNFVIRMVIAISLQKMDTQWAGLADSYYLAALNYFEAVLRNMNLQSVQCLGLVGEYSLLTPTRTAAFFTVGIAARLIQALGIHEEKTLTVNRDGTMANFLEIDMRRRLFWSTMTMEYGMVHVLGRSSCFAMAQEHIDVKWFELVPDDFITEGGILAGAPPLSLKKWIAIHFFKMRLLQLEIRKTLYQKKRPEPKSDDDPWFKQMEAKLVEWRDTSPIDGERTGQDKMWLVHFNPCPLLIHYNFLYGLCFFSE
jgi:hypothetical protein